MSHILIGMIEVGFGHKGPALAIQEALKETFPGQHHIDVLDFPRAVGAHRTDKALKGAWNVALKQTWMVRFSYAFMEVLYPFSVAFLRPLLSDFFTRGGRYLAENPPDLFIATHPMCLNVAALARKRYGLRFPLVADVVDPFDGYSLWADKSADLFLVHSQESRQSLLDHGIDEARIKIVSYPRLPAMNTPTQSIEQLRETYGLSHDPSDHKNSVILATSGSQGLGRVYTFVRRAFLDGLPLDFLVVTGKNRALYEELVALSRDPRYQKLPGRLIPLPFVNSMAELYTICDMVAGKAGAATCMETLYHKKPLICTEWAGQNDYKIIQFLKKNRLGSYTPRYKDFIGLLQKKPVYEKINVEFSVNGIIQELRSIHVISGSM